MPTNRNHGRGQSLRRVLHLARLLEGRRYAPSLHTLAETLDVHPRTIRRDMELLEQAGWPVPKWRYDDLRHNWVPMPTKAQPRRVA